MDDARERDAVETSRDREDKPKATATETETETREDDAKAGMIFQKGDDDEKHVGDAREDDGEARTIARADVEDVEDDARRANAVEETRRPVVSRGTRPASASTTWRRPALAKCSLEDFMYDFMMFHERRGRDWEKAWAARPRDRKSVV